MKQGHYAIIQFRPIPEREEGINVGIITICDGKRIARGINKDDARKALAARLPNVRDTAWLSGDISSLFDRLIESEVTTYEGLCKFASCESGQLVILQPRSCAFENMEKENWELWQKLVMPI